MKFSLYLISFCIIKISNCKTNVVQVQSTIIPDSTCVGARIGDYLILTAAQCFTDEYPPYSVVKVGDKKYQVRYVLRHAEFRGGRSDNIGVIKIREYISTDDVVITQHAQNPQGANARCMVDDGKFSAAVLVADSKSCPRKTGINDICFVYETTQNCDIVSGAPIVCQGHVAAIYIKYHDCLKAKNIAFPSVYKYKDWIRFVDEQLDDDDTVYEIYDADSFPGHNNANNNRDDYYSFYNDYDIDYMHDMDESARFLAQGGNYPDYSSSIAENKLKNMIIQTKSHTLFWFSIIVYLEFSMKTF